MNLMAFKIISSQEAQTNINYLWPMFNIECIYTLNPSSSMTKVGRSDIFFSNDKRHIFQICGYVFPLPLVITVPSGRPSNDPASPPVMDVIQSV